MVKVPGDIRPMNHNHQIVDLNPLLIKYPKLQITSSKLRYQSTRDVDDDFVNKLKLFFTEYLVTSAIHIYALSFLIHNWIYFVLFIYVDF